MATVLRPVNDLREALASGRVNMAGGLRWLALVVLAVFIGTPVYFIIRSTFNDQAPGLPSELTLEPWRQAFAGGIIWDALLTTFRVAIPKVMLAMGLAISFAWIITRTNTPFRGYFEIFLFFMWFTPNLPMIISWILLISPRSGLINKWLDPVLPFGFHFNAYSYEALVVLGAVSSAPILFIFMAPAFRNMDSSLEESAQMSGASLFRRMFHITLPLLMPTILTISALSLILALESFELELLLGTPVGIYVFTARIYDLIYNQFRALYGAGTSLGLVLMAITFVMVIFQRRILAKREYTTITGKGYRPVPIDLGRWRWATFTFLATFCFVFGVLPILVLFANSFMAVSGFYRWELFTFDNWIKAFTDEKLVGAIRNTLVVGALTATIGVFIVAILSYMVVRVRWAGRGTMDVLMWLPIAVPGLVLSLGLLWVGVKLPIYHTVWILMLAFIIRGIPSSSRFFVSTLVQVGSELEESARTLGASWIRTFFSILVPLLKPSFLSAWVFLFVVSARNVDAALLLGGPKTQLLSVTVFQQAQIGDLEVASALGIFMIVLIVGVYLIARALGGSTSAGDR